MTRVLVIADGRGVHSARWVEALISLGHEVHWLATRAIESQHPVASAHVLPTLPANRALGQLFLAANAARTVALCRELQPDIIQAQFLTPCGWYAAATRSLFTVQLWGSDILKHAEMPLHYRAFSRWTLERAAMITADSHNLLRAAAAVAPRAKIGPVLSWGVDTSTFTPIKGEARAQARRALGIDTEYAVVFARNFGTDMNVCSVVRAMAQLPTGLRERTTLVLKKGFPFDIPTEPVHKLIRELRLETSVRVLEEQWGYAEMARLFGAADLFVTIPERGRDGLAQSLLDAIAAGCLPVVSDNPDTLELFGEGKVQGEIVARGSDAAEVAKALVRGLLVIAEGGSGQVDENRRYIREHFERAVCVRRIGETIARVAGPEPREAGRAP